MNPSATITLPNAASAADFLGQCAQMTQTLFVQLRSLIETPPAEPAEQSAGLRRLDSASRILRRLQDGFLAASRTGCQPVPKHLANPKNPSITANQLGALPPNPLESSLPQFIKLAAPCSPLMPPATAALSAPELSSPASPPIPEHKSPQLETSKKQLASESPQPETYNAQPSPDNLQPAIPNPQPGIQNPKSAVQNPQSHPPFRPPLTRNQQKAARRKRNGK